LKKLFWSDSKMSLNHSLLDEVTERSTKLRCKKIKNYDDAIIDRNSTFVAANLLKSPLVNTSGKFRSVGSNTIQELLTSPPSQKQAQKKNIEEIPSADESKKLLEVANQPGYHSGFDNQSSSSEEIIYVDEDTDNYCLMSNPLRPRFGIEGIVFRKELS